MTPPLPRHGFASAASSSASLLVFSPSLMLHQWRPGSSLPHRILIVAGQYCGNISLKSNSTSPFSSLEALAGESLHRQNEWQKTSINSLTPMGAYMLTTFQQALYLLNNFLLFVR
jgi:hypothetical protein